MDTKYDALRGGLLAQLTEPGKQADYRREVESLLEKNRVSFGREQIAVRVLWIACVVLSIGFLWFDGAESAVPKGPWLACFTFLLGMIEVIKLNINRCRIDLLKEVKQVQLQVLEVYDELRKEQKDGAR